MSVALWTDDLLGSASCGIDTNYTNLAQDLLASIDRGAVLRAIDVGGGWPMHYGQEVDPYPPAARFGEAIRGGLEASGMLQPGIEIITEPGRALVQA